MYIQGTCFRALAITMCRLFSRQNLIWTNQFSLRISNLVRIGMAKAPRL